MESNDWRLRYQEEYLMGAKFIFKKYERFSESWEHEHCDFCFNKFSEYKGDLHEGYYNFQNDCWICSNCFNDFKDKFQWEVVEDIDSENNKDTI